MPRLLLIRHAKAAAFGREPGDHGRPLSERGKNDARALGEILKQENWVPDLAIVSTAQRTRDTIAAMALDACTVRYDEALYLAAPKTLANAIALYGKGRGTLALIAHNPGIAMLAHQLIEEGCDHDSSAAQRISEQFKTGWAAAFALREQSPRLVHLFDPRAL